MAALPYIRAEDVEHLLNWTKLADALAEGHKGPKPLVTDQFLSRGPDTLLSRAAWIDGIGIAVKSVAVVPGNGARGLPSVNGAMLMLDDVTGEPLAIIDSALVTKWKTAGDSILGAHLLARPDARRLLIVGAGSVASSLIAAYRAQFPEIEISIWNRNPKGARDLASHFNAGFAEDLREAVEDADIVSTATMSNDPVILGDWLRPGQHLDLIGAYKSDMREVDDTALLRARIFVDSFDTVLDHIGELKDPLSRGVIARTDVLGELRDLVAGRVGRHSEADITLFKNGGGAHLDLLTGCVILAAWQTSQV